MAEVRHETTPEADQWARRPAPPWLPEPTRIVAVACGGMIGATLRWGFTAIFPTAPGAFPLTTFAENVIGSFLLGLLLVLILERWRPRRHVHPFLCTGILGSFTTFSNFSVEMVMLAEAGWAWLGVLYGMGSIVAGLAAALLGVAAARARAWPLIGKRKERS